MWAARLSAFSASPSTTSSMASLTTSSKRDMCAPFWLWAQVHEALQLGVEQLLGVVGVDPDDLLDTGHSHAREADVGAGAAGLDVVVGDGGQIGH